MMQSFNYRDPNPENLSSSHRKRSRGGRDRNFHQESSTSPRSTPSPTSSRSTSPIPNSENQHYSHNPSSTKDHPPPRKRRNRDQTLSSSDYSRLAGISIQSSSSIPSSFLPESQREKLINNETKAPPSSPVNVQGNSFTSQNETTTQSGMYDAPAWMEAESSEMGRNANFKQSRDHQGERIGGHGGENHQGEISTSSLDVDMRSRKPPSTFDLDDHRILVTSLSDSESEEGEDEDSGGGNMPENPSKQVPSSQDSLPTSTDNLLINSELISKLEAEAKKRTLLGINRDDSLMEPSTNATSNPRRTKTRGQVSGGYRRKSSGSGNSSRSTSGNVTPQDVEMGTEQSNGNPSTSALILWKSPSEILTKSQVSNHSNSSTAFNQQSVSSSTNVVGDGIDGMENGHENPSKFQLESKLRRTFSSVSQEADLYKSRSSSSSTIQSSSNQQGLNSTTPSIASNPNAFINSENQTSPFSFGQVVMPSQPLNAFRDETGLLDSVNQCSAWNSWGAGAEIGARNEVGDGVDYEDGDAMELD